VSFQAALIVSVAIIAVTFAVLLSRLAVGRRDATEAAMKAAASTRGWMFTVAVDRMTRVHRWTGTTDGVSWTAESRRIRQRGRGRNRPYEHRAWWSGELASGPASPILLMGVSTGRQRSVAFGVGGIGVVAGLAHKAATWAMGSSLANRFGDALAATVNEESLRPVEGAPAGYVATATDPSAAERLLSASLGGALESGSHDSSSALASDPRPSILLTATSASVAIDDALRTAGDVERLVRAGVAVVTALRLRR
jgi:hypothetical protein